MSTKERKELPGEEKGIPRGGASLGAKKTSQWGKGCSSRRGSTRSRRNFPVWKKTLLKTISAKEWKKLPGKEWGHSLGEGSGRGEGGFLEQYKGNL